MESIENRTVSISLKMLWTIVISIIMGAVSVAGIYVKINDTDNKAETKNQLQDLQIQTLNLNVQKIEIDLRELQKANNSKNEKDSH